MLLTISIIIVALVILNILLLIFSCNKVIDISADDAGRIRMIEETTTKQSQEAYFAATAS